VARALTTGAEAARRNSGALVLVAIVLAACGGGGGGDSQQPASSTGANTATLAWDAVTDPSLAGYRIYYGSAPGTYDQAYGQGVSVGNVTIFTVTGLNSGRRYYFAATAYDMAGNESKSSNEAIKDVP